VLEPAGQDSMGDRRQLTVVVSVVVAPDGRLVYGTVIDVDEGIQGRFVDWSGLAEGVREWLAERTTRWAPRVAGTASQADDSADPSSRLAAEEG
jgi:hypothetical protein